MTDKNLSAVTDEDRRLARDWAEHIAFNVFGLANARMHAAARVILDAVPTPPRPTLADMTDDERAACLRMQCDTAPNRSVRGFIAYLYPGGCRIIERDTWEWRSCSDDMVTPRPDLPRMEWPGTEKAEDVLTVKIDDMIESADDPRLAALPAGSTLLDRDGDTVTKKDREEWTGFGHHLNESSGNTFGPWQVVYIPKGADQ